MQVINLRGEKEPFSRKKVYEACRRSGASKKIAEKVAKKIEKKVYPGIKTKKIGELVKKILSKESKKSSIKFSLKDAMRKLGPSGFDFEKFIADVFAKNNFKVALNRRLPGSCISSYEIDFTATKNKIQKIGECKYHSSPGSRVDLKIALYNHARFLDIKKHKKFKNKNIQSVLVTNTKFTSKVIKYCKCNNIELLGWRYPKNKGLEKVIEKSNFYPITILPSFKKSFKKMFAKKRMMLASDILNFKPAKISQKTNIPIKEVKKLVEEAKILLE